MGEYLKAAQLGSKNKKKKALFGSRPSRGSFGRKPSNGNFTKKRHVLKKRVHSIESSFSRITRGDMAQVLQGIFNLFIRLRDKKEPCISCGSHNASEYHAGHYMPVGSNQGLRFNEDNCHKQCAYCNTSLYGNLKEYRKALVLKIGMARTEKLEKRDIKSPLRAGEIAEMLKDYRGRIEEMKDEKFYTEKEILRKLKETVERIDDVGVDEVISEAIILTHIDTDNPIDRGVEALLTLNPEIRINTLDNTVFCFNQGLMIEKKYPH